MLQNVLDLHSGRRHDPKQVYCARCLSSATCLYMHNILNAHNCIELVVLERVAPKHLQDLGFLDTHMYISIEYKALPGTESVFR